MKYPEIPDTIEALRERTIDAEGESANCNDGECGCHSAAKFLRAELGAWEDEEARKVAR
jgi:hypothetical protein